MCGLWATCLTLVCLLWRAAFAAVVAVDDTMSVPYGQILTASVLDNDQGLPAQAKADAVVKVEGVPVWVDAATAETHKFGRAAPVLDAAGVLRFDPELAGVPQGCILMMRYRILARAHAGAKERGDVASNVATVMVSVGAPSARRAVRSVMDLAGGEAMAGSSVQQQRAVPEEAHGDLAIRKSLGRRTGQPSLARRR